MMAAMTCHISVRYLFSTPDEPAWLVVTSTQIMYSSDWIYHSNFKYVLINIYSLSYHLQTMRCLKSLL